MPRAAASADQELEHGPSESLVRGRRIGAHRLELFVPVRDGGERPGGDRRSAVAIAANRRTPGDEQTVERERVPTLRRGGPRHVGVVRDEEGGEVRARRPSTRSIVMLMSAASQDRVSRG